MKLKIAFIWQGSSDEDTFNHWDDGLRAAMRILEKEYDIKYYEPWDEFDADLILYWESPITAYGKNSQHYNRIRFLHTPKAMLFAGGRINAPDINGFDLFFIESEINEYEFSALGAETIRAFGVNEKVMKPMNFDKIFEGMLQATFANWKRHELFAEALGGGGLAVGRKQKHDRDGYNTCVKNGVNILGEQSYATIAILINKSHTVVNTADYWGGGQRTTLEAMACNVPVIVMSDSIKNIEYVQESGAGLIVDPQPERIREAIKEIKTWKSNKGRDYIMSKWTSVHYADQLRKGIKKLL